MRSWPGSGGSPQVRLPAASGKRVKQGSCISVSCNELSEELQLLALRSSCPTPCLFSLSVAVLRREAVPAQVQHLQGFAPSPSWLRRTIRSACLEAAVPKHPREAGLDVHGTAGTAQPPKSERARRCDRGNIKRLRHAVQIRAGRSAGALLCAGPGVAQLQGLERRVALDLSSGKSTGSEREQALAQSWSDRDADIRRGKGKAQNEGQVGTDIRPAFVLTH